MATTIAAEQTEKAFQKQPIFQNSKIKSAAKKVASKDRRWYKDVGLGFKVSERLLNNDSAPFGCHLRTSVTLPHLSGSG
jgi:small subunit ribosomal protein S11e